MGEDKIKFSEAEILVHSQTLNTASQSLTDTCKNMYDVITKMQENESFKSKLASGEYYAKIDRLNGQVPKFTEGVLKFSKFLSGYLVENYNETDELAKQIQETFNDSLEQLAAVGILGGATVDISKISSTAQGALSGDFISSDKIVKESFEDTGNLDFVTREDGSIMITRDGVPIGFTTEEGIARKDFVDSTAAEPEGDKIISQSDYNKLPEAQREFVDKAGYKVVADETTTVVKNNSSTTGIERAEAYDNIATSNTTKENGSGNMQKAASDSNSDVQINTITKSSEPENNAASKIADSYIAEAEKNLTAAKSERAKLTPYENYNSAQGRINHADNKIEKYQQEVDNLKNGNYDTIIAEKESQLAQQESMLNTAKSYKGYTAGMDFSASENKIESLRNEINTLKANNTSTISATSSAKLNPTTSVTSSTINKTPTVIENNSINNTSNSELLSNWKSATDLSNTSGTSSTKIESPFSINNQNNNSSSTVEASLESWMNSNK